METIDAEPEARNSRPEPTLVLPKSFLDGLPEMARPLLCELCLSLEKLLGGLLSDLW